MLAGFVLGIVQDRRLTREAAVNIAVRWFAGHGFHEPLPDRPSLTRIRQRRGAARFRAIFIRVARDCQRAGLVAGLVAGDVVHIDASPIRANVGFDSLVTQHLEIVNDTNYGGS